MILHIDMNAYFATLEQQANPFLQGRPILVCGKGSGERTVVATASYEAKRLGVKTGMAVWEAKKLVPKAMIVAADYDKYLDTTRRLGEIFEHHTPEVEFFSIDEAFLKITNQNPNVIPNNPESELGTIREAIRVSLRIKEQIREELGQWVTCSIGIAENKLLAKIASEFKKPDGLTLVLPNTNVLSGIHFGSGYQVTHRYLYQQIKLDDIPGIGRRILRRLLKLGITTPTILGATPLPILVKEFGDHWGHLLKNLGKGIDHSPIVRNELMPGEKSFSHSYTLPKEIYTFEDAKKVLLELCEMVGRRMRKKGFSGRTIGVFMRFTDMSAVFERKTFKEYTNDGLQIYRTAESLLYQSWVFRKRVVKTGPAFTKPIRQVGIWVTNLVHEHNLPLPLFEEDRRILKAIKAVDQINDKHGEFTIMRGPILAVYQKIQKIPDGRNRRQFMLSSD